MRILSATLLFKQIFGNNQLELILPENNKTHMWDKSNRVALIQSLCLIDMKKTLTLFGLCAASIMFGQTTTDTIYYQAIKKNLPDWEILDANNYIKELDIYKTNSIDELNFVKGDFNCDQVEDFFTLLYKKNKNELGLWFFYLNDDKYSCIKIDSIPETKYPYGYGISLVNPGQISDMYEETQINLNCNAIQIIKFEAASVIHYWTLDGFKELQTGD
ncbi:hypothetical protein [Marinigracilibium pacificum]|uniref:Uncharacterized protein n=1 Tax=Marinigracilibium pacificum TaxID=2729599 RepID=A0A848J477_9BACT|nr:hypothetical protein [Marinigracilibium pacificum]NMM50526.1 hypothetical protein [Marinigracilibium pacificum]